MCLVLVLVLLLVLALYCIFSKISRSYLYTSSKLALHENEEKTKVSSLLNSFYGLTSGYSIASIRSLGWS